MRTSLHGKTVLVVEDDNDARRLIESRLARSGLRVVSAGSGAEALDLAVMHVPDVITMDVGLGDIDGLEVVRRLLDIETTRSIPIIFITGQVPSRVVEATPLASGRFILRKPYDPRVLLLTLHQALTPRIESDAAGPPARHDPGKPATMPALADLAAPTNRYLPLLAAELPNRLSPREIAEDVAHDARTLLFVITEITHALAAESADATGREHRDLARMIRDRTADLIGICDMLVTGIDLCESPLMPQAERTSVDRMLEEVAPDVRRYLRRKCGTLNLKLRRGLPDIVCDPELLRVALLCLFLSVAGGVGHQPTLQIRADACRMGAGNGVRLALTARCPLQEQLAGRMSAAISEQIALSVKYRLAERLTWICGGRICISGRPQALVATMLIPSAE